MPLLRWYFLGRVGYSEARRLQNRLAEKRSRDEIEDSVLLLEHPPVLTLGRHASAPEAATLEDPRRSIAAPLVRTDRGGALTYHGPGQIVGYPVVRVKGAGRGVRSLVAALEGAMSDVAAEYGVEAVSRDGLPGVWVWKDGEARKLGSIGLGIRRGVSLHGCALNLDKHAEAGFDGLAPCGLTGVRVTSLESCTASIAPHVEAAAPLLADALARRLGEAWQAVEARGSEISAIIQAPLVERADPDGLEGHGRSFHGG